MIVNVLRFSFRPETTAEQRAAILAAMRRTASVDTVSFGTVGQDIGDLADGFTHAFVATVADLDALRRYFYDPVHLEGDSEIGVVGEGRDVPRVGAAARRHPGQSRRRGLTVPAAQPLPTT